MTASPSRHATSVSRGSSSPRVCGDARRPRAGDEGAAAILVLALAALLTLLGSVTVAVGAAATARHRAAAAADLAALAAAHDALQGSGVACAAAARVAAAQAAELVDCRLRGDVAEVLAEVRPPGVLGKLGTAGARARAGPAASGQGG